MKAHVGVDADSGLVHTVDTAANGNDVSQASALVHGEETDVVADAGYQGVGMRQMLDKSTPMGAVMDKLEHVKARIRTKVAHPFRVIKRPLGFVKVRYCGLMKNTTQLHRFCCNKDGKLTKGPLRIRSSEGQALELVRSAGAMSTRAP